MESDDGKTVVEMSEHNAPRRVPIRARALQAVG
jgi:hypothetical protein